MTKEEREQKEALSLYTDQRYAKRAIKKLFNESLKSMAAKLPDFYTPGGDISPQSAIYTAAYKAVENRLKEQGLNRLPTKAEVMVEATVIRAGFDNTAMNMVLDRTAGKVKEELSISSGQYEELSDEELQLLANFRAKKAIAAPEDDTDA